MALEKAKTQLLTVEEAAEALAISPKTMRNWISHRRIGVFRVGRAVRISQAHVDELIEAGYCPPRRAA